MLRQQPGDPVNVRRLNNPDGLIPNPWVGDPEWHASSYPETGIRANKLALRRVVAVYAAEEQAQIA